MDFLNFISSNSYVASLFLTIICIQVTQYFTVRRHTQEIEHLQKAHEENKKLIENIIRMEENIKYIMRTLEKLEQKL